MAEQTQVAAAPKQTQMVAPPKSKTVRVKALREFKIEKYVKDAQGKVLEDLSVMVQPGDVVEVPKTMARDLIKPIQGHYAFSGERQAGDEAPRHDFTRAKMATKLDLEEFEARKKGVDLARPVDELDDLED